ncbi:GNAT family N-acetyltransferase [Ameyamaea chiangmaiensis]|nr:GNAT family N-acetyltransferase [Ameyamaea chiangmaiensis]
MFREWPYLYAGDDEAYERAYLDVYARSARSTVVVARNSSGAVVGASSCLPLADEGPAIRAPFEVRGIDLSPFFYFAESVLLPEYRGQGIGVRFFEERERVARRSGAAFAVFCAVRRADNHPARPLDAPSLEAFWRRRGFVPLPGVSCDFSWTDVGETRETAHVLDFWSKTLHGEVLPDALAGVGV